MASLIEIDRIRSAMSELRQRPWNNYPLIYIKMEDFEDEIAFLARFVDCIRYRSNALELAPHLGSVVTKVEASVQQIEGEFLVEVNFTKWAPVFSEMSIDLVRSSPKEKESKWIDAFDKWVSMMFSLKPDVAEALDSLPINSVQCKIPVHNFQNWERFVMSIYVHVWKVQSYSTAHYWRPERRSDVILAAVPSDMKSLFSCLENDHVKDPKIEAFLTKLGSSIISAELLCCQRWFSNSNTPSIEDISAALRDLDQMIWLTNPEYVDVILRIIKTSRRFSYIEDIAANRHIRLAAVYSENSTENNIFLTLDEELLSLIYSVQKMPEEDNMMVNTFLSDTKQLLMEAASLRHSLYEVNERSVARN